MAKSKLTCTGRLSWCGPVKLGIGICELTNKVETCGGVARASYENSLKNRHRLEMEKINKIAWSH